MKAQQFTPGLEALDTLHGFETLCCFISEDDRPLSGAVGFLDWRLCGALSKILVSGFFVGAPGDKLLVPTEERISARRVFVVGLGHTSAVTALGLEHALTQAAGMLTRAGVESVALAFSTLPSALQQTREELVARSFAPHFSGAVAVFSP